MKRTSSCPKCNYVSLDAEFELCPKCGIIIEKYFLILERKATEEAQAKTRHDENITNEPQQEELKRKQGYERQRQIKITADQQRRKLLHQEEERRRQEELQKQQQEEQRRQEDVARSNQKWKEEEKENKKVYFGKGGKTARAYAVIGVILLAIGFFMDPSVGTTVNLHSLHVKESAYHVGGVFLIMSVISGGINKILLALADMKIFES